MRTPSRISTAPRSTTSQPAPSASCLSAPSTFSIPALLHVHVDDTPGADHTGCTVASHSRSIQGNVTTTASLTAQGILIEHSTEVTSGPSLCGDAGSDTGPERSRVCLALREPMVLDGQQRVQATSRSDQSPATGSTLTALCPRCPAWLAARAYTTALHTNHLVVTHD